MNSLRINQLVRNGDSSVCGRGMRRVPQGHKIRKQDFLVLHLKKDKNIKNKALFEK